jgi:hypothetical protein
MCGKFYWDILTGNEFLMSIRPPAVKVLDREFLDARCLLIDLAAALDRIDRAEGSAADDPRLAQIRSSLEILAGQTPHRAERIQLEFSLPYEKRD